MESPAVTEEEISRVAGRAARSIRQTHHRAKELGASGSHTVDDIVAIYVRQTGKCSGCYCDLMGFFEVDHIIPLVRDGSNGADNLQLLCGPCYKSKGSQIDAEWRACLDRPTVERGARWVAAMMNGTQKIGGVRKADVKVAAPLARKAASAVQKSARKAANIVQLPARKVVQRSGPKWTIKVPDEVKKAAEMKGGDFAQRWRAIAAGSSFAMGVSEVLAVVPLSHDTVQEALRSGELPSYLLGRTRIVMTDDLEYWVGAELHKPLLAVALAVRRRIHELSKTATAQVVAGITPGSAVHRAAADYYAKLIARQVDTSVPAMPVPANDADAATVAA